MLTLDGKPRLVRLVPWSLRDRGFSVEGDPLGWWTAGNGFGVAPLSLVDCVFRALVCVMAGGAGLLGKMVNHGCLNLGVIAQRCTTLRMPWHVGGPVG